MPPSPSCRPQRRHRDRLSDVCGLRIPPNPRHIWCLTWHNVAVRRGTEVPEPGRPRPARWHSAPRQAGQGDHRAWAHRRRIRPEDEKARAREQASRHLLPFSCRRQPPLEPNSGRASGVTPQVLRNFQSTSQALRNIRPQLRNSSATSPTQSIHRDNLLDFGTGGDSTVVLRPVCADTPANLDISPCAYDNDIDKR